MAELKPFEKVYPGTAVIPRTVVRARSGEARAEVIVETPAQVDARRTNYSVPLGALAELAKYTEWLNAAVPEVIYMAMLEPHLTDQWLEEHQLANLSRVPAAYIHATLERLKERKVAVGTQLRYNVWSWRLCQ